MRFRLLLSFCGAALLSAGCRTGVPRDYEPGWDELHLTRIRRELELSARLREEERSSDTSTTSLSEVVFREDLQLFFAGFYYHPKLVDFSGNLRFGLEQRDAEYTNASDSDLDSTNTQYDLTFRLLRDLPYGASVFATRREVLTRRNFFATNEAISESEGFTIHAREWWIPSRFTFRSYSFRGRGGNLYSEESESWRVEGDRYDERGALRYFAEIVEFQRNATQAVERSERASVAYRRWLDEAGMTQLRSNFSADRREGGAETTRVALDNSLDHEFRENLTGDAYLRLRRSGRVGNEVDSVSAGVGLNHRLFSSLTSGVGLGWGHASYESGSSDSWSTNGSVSYRKTVPFGWVRASQSASVGFDRGDAIVGPVAVIGEAQVYTLGVPLFLNSTNVDPASVVVRDSSGLVVYVENVDYFLVQVGSRLRIDIPVSSLISPGDTLLIDYEFLPTPARETRTAVWISQAGFNVHEKLDFGVSYSTTNIDVLEGDAGALGLDDTRVFTARLQGFPTEALSLGAEYEDFDSNQAPFIRYRTFGSWRRPLSASTDMAASADLYWLEQDSMESERGSTARLALSARLGAGATGTLSAQYRRVKLRQDEGDGYLVEAAYRRRWGPTSLQLSAQYVQEEFLLATDQEIFRFEAVITRSF